MCEACEIGNCMHYNDHKCLTSSNTLCHLSIQPLLPPHLRSNQTDTQPSKSDSSSDIVSGSNQEHNE